MVKKDKLKNYLPLWIYSNGAIYIYIYVCKIMMHWVISYCGLSKLIRKNNQQILFLYWALHFIVTSVKPALQAVSRQRWAVVTRGSALKT